MLAIDKIPGAFWVWLIGAISAMGTIYLVTQYPDNAPAWVAAALTGLGMAVGGVKLLWPTPTVPLTGDPAVARSQAPAPARPSAVSRFFF